MKPNSASERQFPEEYVTIESRLERGRQLHAAAVFDVCAGLLKRLRLTGLIREKQTRQPLPYAGSDLVC